MSCFLTHSVVVFFVDYFFVDDRVPDVPCCRHGTGSLGHRVNGSSFWPGVRREFSRFSKKCPKCKTYIWNAEMTSHCQASVVGLKSLDVSPCNELLLLPMIIKNSLAWEYFFTHKSTFGVHYRTGWPGQLGLRAAGFPGHWVTKCDPVPSLPCCIVVRWYRTPATAANVNV